MKELDENCHEFERLCKENIQIKKDYATSQFIIDEAKAKIMEMSIKLSDFEGELIESQYLSDHVLFLEKKVAVYERKDYYSLKNDEINLENFALETSLVNDLLILRQKLIDKEDECEKLNHIVMEKDEIIELLNKEVRKETLLSTRSNEPKSINIVKKAVKVSKNVKQNKKINLPPKRAKDIGNNTNITVNSANMSEKIKTKRDANAKSKKTADKIEKSKNTSKISIAEQENNEPTIKFKRLKSKISINSKIGSIQSKSKKNMEEKNKLRTVLILTDENGKTTSSLMNDLLPLTYRSTCITKTYAQFHGICKVSKTMLNKMTKDDYVIVMGGLHYSYLREGFSKNQTLNSIETNMAALIEMSKNTNLLVCDIPYRLDNNSYNYDILDINKKNKVLCAKHKHVKFVPLTDVLIESDYTHSGATLNVNGKKKFCSKAKESIFSITQDHPTSYSKNGGSQYLNNLPT